MLVPFNFLMATKKFKCDNVTYIWTDGSPTDCLWWQPDYPKSEFAEFSCVTVNNLNIDEMNIKRFQIWETDWLYDNPAYIPGQYDDMKECSDDGSNVICKYDPNTCKCSAAFYVSKGLTFSEYWCKI